jgi:D-beta-D-heptose 7-phosphate kinase/D-beta-D-heptose 1-phosphate adenosyltransferase
MIPLLNRTRLEDLLGRFTGKTILVLGDLMLDQFIWGNVRRISPEAPVPVIDVTEETYRLGGSANVAANIRALGGTVVPIGVLGRDSAGDRAIDLLQGLGIESSGVIFDDRTTTLKTRIIAHNQHVVRTDRESKKPLTSEVTANVVEVFLKYLPEASAIIISDYNKGVVNKEILFHVLPPAHSQGTPVFLDPKIQHSDYYRPITVITPNHHEAELLLGIRIDDQHTLEEAGRRLLEKFDCEHVLITRGEEGMSLFDRQSSHHLPTFAREVFDVTGAGDTVIATLALARASGATMQESAILANYAAGLAVGKVGTATVSRSDLLHFDLANTASMVKRA